MRLSTRMVWLLVALGLTAAGCNQNRFQTAQLPSGMPSQQPVPYVAQVEDLDRRATALDADNRDLHSQLARSQQHAQLLEEHVKRLNKELAERASQLQELLAAKEDSQQQLEAIQATTRRGGGATITANNSLHDSLASVSLPGLEVRREDGVLRLELSADQIFQQGSSQLLPASRNILDQVSAAITENYPRQIVGVEGHTDSRPLGASSNHQLSSQQALAVFQVLTSRNRLPSQQLFTVGYGANHPRASNATPAGRAKNRRIELVIYPDKFSQ